MTNEIIAGLIVAAVVIVAWLMLCNRLSKKYDDGE